MNRTEVQDAVDRINAVCDRAACGKTLEPFEIHILRACAQGVAVDLARRHNVMSEGEYLQAASLDRYMDDNDLVSYVLAPFYREDDRWDAQASIKRLLREDEPIKVGVWVVTLLGEEDTDESGGDRYTPPMSVGKIVDLNHEDTWDLTFPSGAWVCPTEAELRDPTQYTLYTEL